MCSLVMSLSHSHVIILQRNLNISNVLTYLHVEHHSCSVWFLEGEHQYSFNRIFMNSVVHKNHENLDHKNLSC